MKSNSAAAIMMMVGFWLLGMMLNMNVKDGSLSFLILRETETDVHDDGVVTRTTETDGHDDCDERGMPTETETDCDDDGVVVGRL